MKKQLKSIISIILVIIFALTALVGCKKSTEDSGSAQYSSEVKDSNTKASKSDNESIIIETTEESISYDFVLDEEAIFMNTDEGDRNAYNSEEYKDVKENSFLSVKEQPLSTFSIDVDTASYSNIRRMILDGMAIPKEAVRIEEMINYFTYNYESPKDDLPFSIHSEASDCPWNKDAKLLLIGLQGKDIDLSDRPSSNLVFLLDVSGSMNEPDKLPLMQRAFIMLAENLNENDRISIVTYAGIDSVVLEGARGNETRKIANAIESLEASGSTAGEAGIKKAYDLAKEYFIKGGNNRIILATDGDLNVGISSESELTKLIEEKRESGVFLSVLGFGTGNLKDNKLEALADNGNGTYSYIDSILEAKKVLVEELGGTLFTIAKDVKLQIEFNPRQIKGYRLIGYENRQLENKDFDNDKKDAGDIGAGHSVTALYEIIEASSDYDIPESDLKYSESTYTNSEEWMNVKIRYKEPDENESKLLTFPLDSSIYRSEMPKTLSFASSVAAFGMLLKDSEYKGSASIDMVLKLLSKYDDSYDEYKEEYEYLVRTYSRQ